MSMAKGDGVTWYTYGYATVTVPFPEDKVCCRYCPYMRADAGGARHKCGLTGDVILRLDMCGAHCPVVYSKEGQEDGSRQD